MSEGEPEHVGLCGLCDPPRRIAAAELIEHLRSAHGVPVVIELWPDGEPVVVDRTLEPEDFEP